MTALATLSKKFTNPFPFCMAGQESDVPQKYIRMNLRLHFLRRLAHTCTWLTSVIAAMAVLILTTGCATGPRAVTRNAADPFEPVNRNISRFNDVIDDNVLMPVATAYSNVLPSTVRTGVNNFFGNLGDVWNFVNNVLQLKAQDSAETFMRLNVNTFLGLGGLLDIATELGIERHPEDFGQTLGHWGMPTGPYVVLPLLGPSTVRDTAALPVNVQGDLLRQVSEIPARNSLYVLRVIDLRSIYLGASQLLEDAALDRYSFTRDAYLQRRRSEVYDGNPPEDEKGFE